MKTQRRRLFHFCKGKTALDIGAERLPKAKKNACGQMNGRRHYFLS
jgi:hypothetical protein